MERAPKFPCAFCKEGHYGDAGGSYDRAHCEERDILNKLETTKCIVPQSHEEAVELGKEITRLKRRLEQARYHGD